MGRVATAFAVVAALGLPTPALRAEPTSATRLVVFADVDDDDDDGVADAASGDLKKAAGADVLPLPKPAAGRLVTAADGDVIRLVVDGRAILPPVAEGRRVRESLGVQGLRAGSFSLRVGAERFDGVVLELRALDSGNRVIDLARSHASITRVLPRSLEPDGRAEDDDPDALRWVVLGPAGALPTELELRSTRPTGAELDSLARVPATDAPCPPDVGAGLACRTTPLIRATSDEVDRSHPRSLVRSLRAEVGGRLAILVDGREGASIRVGGPRETALGPLARYRGRLRARIVRLSKNGSVPVGGSDQGAIALVRGEVGTASMLWGQCGVHFGYGRLLDIRVVDPPPAHMLAVGCDLGLPSSGGVVTFEAGTKKVEVSLRPGLAPVAAAHRIAAAIQARGFSAIVSPNSLPPLGALRTADVLVRTRSGAPVVLSASAPLSTDATMDVCLGEVDLSDGLSHFTDYNAVAGTVEERALIKALDDGDPTTIEVVIIPSFAKSGRIGESFIHTEGASMANAVILDRAGIRAGARSYALAHELGHVLLDMPGHPDDFGVDTPGSLMDADAADPTIFGPRRLSVGECERAILQSGPDAPVPLLEKWPLIAE